MKKTDPCSSRVIGREVTVGPVIHKMDKMLSRNMAAKMRASGLDELTLMHGWIVHYLYDRQEEEVFQKDIEKFFSIGRSTVTNIIQLMEKNGYIARESVPGDARLKKVRLTKKGITSHEMLGELIARLDRELVQGITEEELDTFYIVMNKIKGNLKAEWNAGEEDVYASCIAEGSKGI